MTPPPIPRAMLVHRVTVEPPAGESSGGTVYGDGVELRCWRDGKSGSARATDGTTVTTSGSLLLRPEDEAAIPVGSRVTDQAGRVTYVVALDQHDGGGLVPLSHIKVDLA